MKKEYEAPKAEKMDFDYKEAVVASDLPSDEKVVYLKADGPANPKCIIKNK